MKQILCYCYLLLLISLSSGCREETANKGPEEMPVVFLAVLFEDLYSRSPDIDSACLSLSEQTGARK
jgi:hypothetical protein